jgi:hypothetical protein
MTRQEIEREIRIERMKDDPDGDKIDKLKFMLDNRKINTTTTYTYFTKKSLAVTRVNQTISVVDCKTLDEYKQNGYGIDKEEYIFNI